MARVTWFLMGVIVFSLLLVGPVRGECQQTQIGPTSPVPAPSGAPAEPPPDPMQAAREFRPPPIQKVSPGVFEIGGVRIEKNQDKVEFAGQVNMKEGLLEYVLVGGGGKLHESLLRTEIEPYCLQIALLLMGLEGTSKPLAMQGDPGKPTGDPVEVWVEWDLEGKSQRRRIEELVMNKQDNKPMKLVDWVFTGSLVHDGIFMAQVEKSIIAIFHDPAAMIDNPLEAGASDEIWFVNEANTPPVGTTVRISIEKKSNKQ